VKSYAVEGADYDAGPRKKAQQPMLLFSTPSVYQLCHTVCLSTVIVSKCDLLIVEHAVKVSGQYYWDTCIQGAPIKNNPLGKLLYFSNGVAWISAKLSGLYM